MRAERKRAARDARGGRQAQARGHRRGARGVSTTTLRRLALAALAFSIFAASALAGGSTTYAGSTSSCDLYHPLPLAPVDQPVVSCHLEDSGTLTLGACDAAGCDVVATGRATASWNPPGYGYLQVGMVQFYPNASAPICVDIPSAPASSAACSGTSSALHATVGAGGCREVYVSSSVVLDYATTPYPLPYMAAYLAIRVDHAFRVCRDASGAASIVALG